MARLPRLELAGVAQHVVQRGNNRLPCFLDDADRRCYQRFLREALQASGCDLHAYVLMNNHVHMLLRPPEVGAVARLMQMLGRSYVGAFNARHRRTGTLWEGRYKSCLVDAQEYLLNCYRYIELNPVRARMVEDPVHHQWSSYAFNGTCRPDPLLTPHPCYDSLGADHPSRAAAYQVIVRQALPDETVEEIRTYLQQQRALGRDDFRSMVEAKTQRFAGIRPAHRPANSHHSRANEPGPVPVNEKL